MQFRIRTKIGSGEDLLTRDERAEFGMSERHVHAEASEEANDALRDRQRLSVRRRVSPRHSDLLALERLERVAKVRLDVAQVGERLRGVVAIGLQVDHGRAKGKRLLNLRLLERIGKVDEILMRVAKEEVITNADDLDRIHQDDSSRVH